MPLKKTGPRLSWHLGTKGLGGRVNPIIARETAQRVKAETWIVADATDLKKS